MTKSAKLENGNGARKGGRSNGRPDARHSEITLSPGYKPSEDEPFMNERHRLYFRTKLLAWKEDILRQTRETLMGLHNDTSQHADLADRATSETDKALELRPKFSQAHYNLGNLYLNRAELARAAASLRMALDIDPEFVEARLALATALVNDGKPDEAAAVLTWIVEKRPDHPAIPKVRSFLESLKK